MVAPSLLNNRRFPQPLRARIQVAYARAWEALAETHRAEVVRFVRRVAARVGPEEALHRYFREVAVPSQMQESVRARAIIDLQAELAAAHGATSDGVTPAEALAYLRPDHVVGALKRRAHHVEETNLCCQLAASLADEAVCVTHVRNAAEIAGMLTEAFPVTEAIMHYIRAFELPMVEAQMVFQRTLAQLAERHPMLAQATQDLPAEVPAESAPRLSRPSMPAPVYGLRAIG
jgi:hypothetical protein